MKKTMSFFRQSIAFSAAVLVILLKERFPLSLYRVFPELRKIPLQYSTLTFANAVFAIHFFGGFSSEVNYRLLFVEN